MRRNAAGPARTRRTLPAMLARAMLLSVGLLVAIAAQGDTMDYDLNQAIRTIADVTGGLERLRPGDVSSYNRLGAKLTKAAGHLQATQSQAHEQYQPAVAQWSALQAQMAAIAQSWQAAQAQAQAQAAQAESPAEPQPAPASKPLPRAQPAAAAVDLDPLMDKYQRNNLPVLPEAATPEQGRAWAEAMKGLQTARLAADLAVIDSALASGAASAADADRVRRWITDSFQRTIQERIDHQVQAQDGAVSSMVHLVDLIERVGPDDGNGAYRVAGEVNGPANAARLDDALRAGAVAAQFDVVFDRGNPERVAMLRRVAVARQKFDALAPLAAKQAQAFASAPAKRRPVTKDFLAPIAQKFWLNGNVAAESDRRGGIWIDSNEVGNITHNGKIWVASNERGSIEPDGKVWFDGNQVGSLEANGEVWRGGNQVGLIDSDGTAWVGGNPAGEVEPYQGEWQRAAILYYFRDFFRP